MRIAAGIFVFFILSVQICKAQQYFTNWDLNSIFFYNEASTSAEGTGKIYLNNNNDAYSALYNPALSSRANNIRFSYSTSQKFNDYEHILFNNYGIDVPIKNIGTFSFTRRYYDYKYYIGDPNPEGSINYTSYNLNYSRELYKGLSGGIGFNYFKVDVPYIQENDMEYYSFNLGASYVFNLPTSDYYSQHVLANVSILNLPISYSKKIAYTYYSLPQIDHISLGYSSKYGALNNLDVFQTDIQFEYSDLLNSKYYNTISLGAEIKFLEAISLRAGYYNTKGEYFTYDDFTYGIGFSYPFKAYLGIPMVIGFDYSGSKYPYFDPNTKYYFNSYALYLKYDM
jgi:hypothetical protein